MSDLSKLVADAKLWVEQEKAWDESLYATAGSVKAGNETADQRNSGLTKQRVNETAGDPPVRSPASTQTRLSADPTLRASALTALYDRYKDCTRCALGPTRIKFVFGVGNPNSEVLFIGEGPGYEEDRRGEPFVGKAGQLLDKMLAAIELSRQKNAYIANIVKCHPMANPLTPEARGNDRPPAPEEVETCAPILLQQIAIIQPKIIVTLGSPSTKMILHTKDGITGLRGKLFPFDVGHFYPENSGSEADLFQNPDAALKESNPLKIDSQTRQTLKQIQVLPTYHPAALLRNPNLKPESWEDLKLLRKILAGA